MLPDLSRRALVPELMDDPAVDAHDLFPSLRFLERLNMLPGTADLVVRMVLGDLESWKPGPTLRLIDVGTGGADVALEVARRFAGAGRPARVTGLDLHARTLEYARGRIAGSAAVSLVRGDALQLPLASRSVDYAFSTTFLHHLDDRQAERCLQEMFRVARRGVVVIDLERSRLAYLGVRLVTLMANRVARHDGPVSVRRAFTHSELRTCARGAGLPSPCISRHAPFRLALMSTRPANP